MGIASWLLFILLVEWLRPLQQASSITEIYMLEPFQFALFGFVALDYLRIHGLLSWPLKLAVALVVISVFYYDSYLFEWSWWDEYLSVTAQDLESLAHNRPAVVSGENRTMLMLAGLALVAYALHYIVIRRQYIGWFIAVTIGYLAGLQIGFGLSTTHGIIVSLVAGVFMIALLQPVRWRSILNMTAWGQPAAPATDIPPARLFKRTAGALKHAAGYAGAILIATAALAAGWLASADQPKLSQPLRWDVLELAQDVSRWTNGRWPDPSGQDWSKLANLALTGYSSGDYELGGSVIPANFPILSARSEKLTYWRGEIKAYYDGASWSDPPAWYEDSSGDKARTDGDVRVIASPPSSTLAVQPIEQEVQLDRTAAMFLKGTIFADGEIVAVTALTGDGEISLDPQLHPLERDELSLRYIIDTGEDVITAYRITVVPIPHDHIDGRWIDEASRIANEQGLDDHPHAQPIGGGTHTDNGQRPDDHPHAQRIDDPYLSSVTRSLNSDPDAPSNDGAIRTAAAQGFDGGLSAEERRRYTQLPEMGERVFQLAAQLTAGLESDLGMARAIADYLRSNYTYDLHAADQPAEGAEFVEHFLFEQHVGYCDHFSTAMAVLLRMNGIPARWVKGFAPGEVKLDESGYVWSDVRALHAHSWVEAYLSGIGWVAFEPTPSYAGSLETAAVVLAASQPDGGIALSERKWWQGPALILASEAKKEVELMDGDWLTWVEMKFADWKDRMLSVDWSQTAVLAAAAASVVVLALTTFLLLRHRLSYIRLERRFDRMERRGGTAQLLELMWQRIIRKYGPLQPGQTLREYVQGLELRRAGQREALAELALLYEAIRYDEQLPKRISRGRMSRLWREAIG